MATRMTNDTAARHSAPMICHSESFGKPDHQSGDHGAGHRADTSQNGGGKEGKQQVKAHGGAYRHHNARHDAANGSERSPQHPDHANDGTGVDACKAGEIRIFRDGPHGAACRRFREEQMHRNHHDNGQYQDQ